MLDREDDLADQPARPFADPAGELVEDVVAEPLQGAGDRRGDRPRDRAAHLVAGVPDRVAAADRPAGKRADTAGDGVGGGGGYFTADAGPRRRRRGLGKDADARQEACQRDCDQ